MERKCRFCQYWKPRATSSCGCGNKNVGVVGKQEYRSGNRLYVFSVMKGCCLKTDPDFGCIHFQPDRLRLSRIAKAIRKNEAHEGITPAELKEMLTYWSLKPAHLAHLLGVTRQCVNDWLKRDKHPIPRIAVVAMNAMGLLQKPDTHEDE
ncbi:MAG: hypothetical protein WCN95_08025 [bacterium]